MPSVSSSLTGKNQMLQCLRQLLREASKPGPKQDPKRSRSNPHSAKQFQSLTVNTKQFWIKQMRISHSHWQWIQLIIMLIFIINMWIVSRWQCIQNIWCERVTANWHVKKSKSVTANSKCQCETVCVIDDETKLSLISLTATHHFLSDYDDNPCLVAVRLRWSLLLLHRHQFQEHHPPAFGQEIN